MGSWSVSCGISNIAITSGNECCLIPLKEQRGSEYGGYVPTTLPIFGKYNDYGGMEEIIKDENTKLIENHLGITIDEFVEFLVDGKFTYDREEAKEISEKLNKNEKLKEVEKWRFMWVDKKVYDFMTKNYDDHEKGHHDFGTPEMLKLLGFTQIEVKEEEEIKNYDSKRFNKKYQKDKLFVYSDGHTMLSEKNNYIFYTNKGRESSLETYIKIPEDLKFIAEKTSSEIWRLQNPKIYKKKLGYIFGESFAYDFEYSEEMLELLKSTKSDFYEKRFSATISKQYFDRMELFGDMIVGLINVRSNMYVMSSKFAPHVLYLTPQCGEYKQHQMLLEEFCRINKSYIQE